MTQDAVGGDPELLRRYADEQIARYDAFARAAEELAEALAAHRAAEHARVDRPRTVDRAIPRLEDDVRRLVADGQILDAYVQEVAEGLAAAGGTEPDEPPAAPPTLVGVPGAAPAALAAPVDAGTAIPPEGLAGMAPDDAGTMRLQPIADSTPEGPPDAGTGGETSPATETAPDAAAGGETSPATETAPDAAAGGETSPATETAPDAAAGSAAETPSGPPPIPADILAEIQAEQVAAEPASPAPPAAASAGDLQVQPVLEGDTDPSPDGLPTPTGRPWRVDAPS